MVSTLCNTILKNQRLIYTLSTLAQGFHGIKEEVFISLPVVVGESGITSVFNQKLSESEQQKILKSATQLRDIIKGIKL
jgi:L-lactate dehydrogenase